MSVNISAILMNALNPDKTIRESAEQQLQNAAKENLALYLELLIGELANEAGDPNVRQSAALAVKNALTAKDNETRVNLHHQWTSLDPNSKQNIRQLSLQVLGSATPKIGSRAALVVAAIAAVDLPQRQWDDLINILLDNVTNEATASNINLRKASLETIGYICEEIDPQILESRANNILTAVVSGARSDDPSTEIRLAGIQALFNSLEFVQRNFEDSGERNYIMQVVCEATLSRDPNVRVAAFECLVKIMHLYYDYMTPYMEQALFALTVDAMKSNQEGVSLQAIEFWSTICDEELELEMERSEAEQNDRQPDRTSSDFAKKALPHTIPVLTQLLTQQSEDDDEDDWNVAMASATCLSLMAQCVGDAIVPHVFPFVNTHIGSSDWRYREAAVMAFGSILEGPTPGTLNSLVDQAIPVLIQYMNDQTVQVQDTTAWTLGRICDQLPESIDGDAHMPSLVTALVSGLQRAPRVAVNCAWSITNIAENFGDDGSNMATSALSKYYEVIVQALLVVTTRSDGDESNLRTGAYEALSTLSLNAAQDCSQVVLQVTQIMLDRLEKSIQTEVGGGADENQARADLQANICGVLQNIVRRLGTAIRPFADRMMEVFLHMFAASSVSRSGRSGTFLEDALLAIGSLVMAMEQDFIRYMPLFVPVLNEALKNYEENQVCMVAVGLVGDVCRALGDAVEPYCNTFMSLLMQIISARQVDRNLKPHVLSCFGDVALAINTKFEPYFDTCMHFLLQACNVRANPEDFDSVDYVNQLREGILEAFTGIVQGLKSQPDRLIAHTESMIKFVEFVFQDPERTDSINRTAIGLIGDIVDIGNPQVNQFLSRQAWLKEFITEVRTSKNISTKEVAEWTRSMLQKVPAQ